MRSGECCRMKGTGACLRAGGAMVVALALLLGSALPGAAQSSETWTFEDDAFADLWFYGLAVVGFFGFGPFPLYDAQYALDARVGDRASRSPTSLEGRRAEFLAAFRSDDAFEILHFVPLYFRGASREAAVAALRAVATRPEGGVDSPPRTRFGATVVAGTLTTPAERRTLAAFLDALDEEWRAVAGPRWQRDLDRRQRDLAELRAAWARDWAPPLAEFLSAEGFSAGTVLAVPALGAEGRFLDRNPSGRAGPLVALGLPADSGGLQAALSSLVRELCYPAVRRAFASVEVRLPDRVEASRAGDLAATRCGELLLERRAPAHLTAYRARFGLPPQGSGRAFLSASGRVPGAAAWEGAFQDALLRELNLKPDVARPHAPPVWRKP